MKPSWIDAEAYFDHGLKDVDYLRILQESLDQLRKLRVRWSVFMPERIWDCTQCEKCNTVWFSWKGKKSSRTQLILHVLLLVKEANLHKTVVLIYGEWDISVCCKNKDKRIFMHFP